MERGSGELGVLGPLVKDDGESVGSKVSPRSCGWGGGPGSRDSQDPVGLRRVSLASLSGLALHHTHDRAAVHWGTSRPGREECMQLQLWDAPCCTLRAACTEQLPMSDPQELPLVWPLCHLVSQLSHLCYIHQRDSAHCPPAGTPNRK